MKRDPKSGLLVDLTDDEISAASRGGEYLAMERETERQYSDQPKVAPDDVLPSDAIAHYIDHSAEFIQDLIVAEDEYGTLSPVKLDDWQLEACAEIDKNEGAFLSIGAGSGVGKSFWLSKIIYWFLTTRKGKVPCTAPTEHQLFDVLWSELKKDYDNNPFLQKLFMWTQTKVFMKGYAATWFAVARTATVRKDGKVLEGLQGFHDPNLLYVVDEASGVPDSAMAAVDGALTAPNAKIIMTSNPTRLVGRFYNSHHKSNRDNGGPWWAKKISCFISRFVGKAYLVNMLREHGEDSPVYKAKVLGEFPDQEENALISKSEFERAWSGKQPAVVHLLDDLHDIPPPSAPEAYRSRLFKTQEHEAAARGFFGKIGFRGLIGRSPNTGMSAGRFRPPGE